MRRDYDAGSMTGGLLSTILLFVLAVLSIRFTGVYSIPLLVLLAYFVKKKESLTHVIREENSSSFDAMAQYMLIGLFLIVAVTLL